MPIPGIAVQNDTRLCLRRCFVPNLAAVLVGVYSAYYIVLEWFAGSTWTAFVGLPLFVTANAFQQVPKTCGLLRCCLCAVNAHNTLLLLSLRSIAR